MERIGGVTAVDAVVLAAQRCLEKDFDARSREALALAVDRYWEATERVTAAQTTEGHSQTIGITAGGR